MGEFIVKERAVSSSLDRAVTIPVAKMKIKRCRYGFLLTEEGKLLDDLIAYRIEDGQWMLVVNAGTVDKDFRVIQERLSSDASIENISEATVKIDVQGPRSLEVMKALVGDTIKKLTYYGLDFFNLMGGTFLISRTGYTGELGYEIYIDSRKGADLWKQLLSHPAVKPAGLGARDILRLEMGLPLYGNEFTEETTPLDGGMERFLDMDKDFTGKQALLEQQKRGVVRRLAGFTVDGRRTPRHGNRILAELNEVGFVTSGVFSPHLNRGIGMGYIDAGRSGPGGEISIDTGKGEIRAVLEPVPFLKNTSIKYSEA